MNDELRNELRQIVLSDPNARFEYLVYLIGMSLVFLLGGNAMLELAPWMPGYTITYVFFGAVFILAGIAVALAAAVLRRNLARDSTDPARGPGQPWDPLESTCRHASLSIL